MEDLIKETAKQVPNLASLIALVWLFLKHQKQRDVQMNSLVMTFSKESEDARRHSREVIESNTAVMAQVKEVIRGCKHSNSED